MVGLNTVDGLASGLDTTGIVDAVINAARGATRVTENRKALFEARLEAVRTLNTRLLSASLDASSMKAGGTFTSKSATVGSPSVLSATASTNTPNGTYEFEVVSLATAHQIATGALGGETSRTDDLGAGNLTLQVGNSSPLSIDLTADASSLDDIAAAINAAEAGVSAYVIDNGDATNPFQLVLQSAETGSDGAITITNADGGLASLFASGNLSELTAAGDAQLKLGSGPGAITLDQSSNTFAEIVPGLTLEAKAVGSTSVVVGTDTSKAKDAITNLVDSVNSALEYLNANTAYDPDTQEGGILISETDLRRGVNSLVATLFSADDRLPTSMNNVTSLGLGIDRDSGLITIDEEVLDAKLAAEPDAVANLFKSTGTSSDTGVEFAALNKPTDVTTPFVVEITAAAEQAQSQGNTYLATDTITVDSNTDDFSVVVNGNTYNVLLASGTYSRNDFVSHLETVVNQAADPGDQVTVGYENDVLTISSARYGAGQTIQVNASSANTLLGFETTENNGVDVAGTINGQAASGSGQVLQGTTGAAEGLYLLVTAEAPVAGVTVTARKGLAQELQEVLQGLTDADTGSVTAKETSLEDTIADLTQQITEADERLELRRERLRQQFVQMEILMAQFQSQGDFLAGQIKGFENAASARSQ